MTVLITILVIQSLGYIYLAYNFFKKKPVKQQLMETEAKLKIEEVFNNEIKTLLPDNPTDRLKRFKELAGTD